VQDIAGLAGAGCAGAIGRGIAKNAVADADVLLGIKAPLGQQSLALGRFKRLFCAVDPAGAQTDAGRGQQQIAHHKAGVLHAPFGKVSFGAEKLCGNLKALVEAVIRQKPAAAKGNYLLSMAVSSTMGPGYKIDLTQVKKFLEG